jgi:hypothetical protein
MEKDMIDPEELAQHAYYSLIERAHQIQQRIIKRSIGRQLFGADYIERVAGLSSLQDAEQGADWAEIHDREQLACLLPIIRQLEAKFRLSNEGWLRNVAREWAASDQVRRGPPAASDSAQTMVS